MNIYTALSEGLVEGIKEKPERAVETVMSDVFIYENVVRKVYKERKGVFVDMTDQEARKDFYLNDFKWNQSVSPEIHSNLYGIGKRDDGTYFLTDFDQSEVWMIEMKRVQDSDTLFNRLTNGTASTDDVVSFIDMQTEALKRLTDEHLDDHSNLLEQSLQKLWEDRIDNDLRAFGKSFGKEIEPDLTDKRIDSLLNYFRNNSFLQELSSEDASVMIDNHAGNVVFHNDKPQFIDIFLPKREWRVLDHHNNISRIAACVRTLGNDEMADSMYEAYSRHYELAPSEVYDFQEAYNALIKGYYYTYLEQPEVAKKYFALADGTIEKL